MRILWIVLLEAVMAITAGFSSHYWHRPFHLPAPQILQEIAASDGCERVFVRNRELVGELAEFDDGLFAFLMFDYLRGQPALADKGVMLVSSEEQDKPVYHIFVKLPADLIRGVILLSTWKTDRLTPAFQVQWILPSDLSSYLQQTSAFLEAYNGPASKHLGTLHAPELQRYLERFIRFKSETDPRISSVLEPIPSPLTQSDATQLAADIIAVAHFYDVPVDLFVGIGAMENNYLNVAGDLKNTIWKRRAERGDIVLKRRGKRVLVRNDSMGVWQITRQSLRYAHKLYLNDKRDYTQLPERLRPPKELDFDSIGTGVLTTYAGLLLRDLLDRFHGDIATAAGAYNGGPANPNTRYAAGVEMVANYARRVIGRAADLSRLALEQSSVRSDSIRDTVSPRE